MLALGNPLKLRGPSASIGLIPTINITHVEAKIGFWLAKSLVSPVVNLFWGGFEVRGYAKYRQGDDATVMLYSRRTVQS